MHADRERSADWWGFEKRMAKIGEEGEVGRGLRARERETERQSLSKSNGLRDPNDGVKRFV